VTFLEAPSFQEGALDLLLNKRNWRGEMQEPFFRARSFIYFKIAAQ
jgi:hypothetical protein